MTIIMPAGSKRFDWAPKEEQQILTKTASTGEIVEAPEEINPLYEAAKKVVEAQVEDIVLMEPEPVVDEIDGVEEVSAPAEIPEGSATDVEQAVKEVVEKAEKAEACIETVEECIDKVEEAAQAAKDAVSDAIGEVSDAVEDTEDDEVAEIEIEIEDEEGDDESDVLVKEGDEDDTEVEACSKTSKSANDFERYSKISPENRTKLQRYWTQDLGYSPDYVKLLVKDYEK